MTAASLDIFPLSITPFSQKEKGEDASLQTACKSKESALNPDSSNAVNLMDLDLQGLRAFFIDLGEKPFRADQIMKWVHQRGVTDFQLMTDLSKAMREQLPQICTIKAPEVAEEFCSKDGTRKWLIRLADGNQIETVFIPERTRGTLCVSSQVGCALNCTFCSTATQGFSRNLTVAEIIGQVWLVTKRLRELEAEEAAKESSDEMAPPSYFIPSLTVTNIVMMGMGEPLLNYDAVTKALSIMRDDKAYAFPRRRVTLSTSGVVPEIYRLSLESDVSLAVSLHAPIDDLRDILVPINKKYPIQELLKACRQFVSDKSGRHITMEYVMLRGVNDKKEHAKQLVTLLQGLPCKINLIPFNPFSGAEYQCSSPEDMEVFKQVCVRAGYITTLRKTRGEDIAAACGQLVGKFMDRTRRKARFMAKNGIQEVGYVEANL